MQSSLQIPVSGLATTLAEMDALAVRLIARASPLRFGVADSAEALEAVFRLRYRVVIEHRWASPAMFTNDRERDNYDDNAIQLVAWDDADLIATGRLVLPVAGQASPTEAAFDLVCSPSKQVVDVGRMCLSPAYRAHEQRVFWALLAQTWLVMRDYGFMEASAILTTAMARMYQKLGFHVVVLGSTRLCWGEQRFPALVQPVDTKRTVSSLASTAGVTA